MVIIVKIRMVIGFKLVLVMVFSVISFNVVIIIVSMSVVVFKWLMEGIILCNGFIMGCVVFIIN